MAAKFKTITTTIPSHFKWRAIDSDGSIFVYSKKPKMAFYGWHPSDSCCRYAKVGNCRPSKDWTRTLEKI